MIFDGTSFAAQKEKTLTQQLTTVVQKTNTTPQIAAILFSEDPGSRLYTRKKSEAADRVGMKYQTYEFSFKDPVESVVAKISELNQNPQITGIIIQKPARFRWLKWKKSIGSISGGQPDERSGGETQKNTDNTDKKAFIEWWKQLVQSIDPQKDVDGLSPSTLAAIQRGDWPEQGRVLPATVKAVISVMDEVDSRNNFKIGLVSGSQIVESIFSKKIIILGKSDILGLPLFF